jgi:hypothetical protein
LRFAVRFLRLWNDGKLRNTVHRLFVVSSGVKQRVYDVLRRAGADVFDDAEYAALDGNDFAENIRGKTGSVRAETRLSRNSLRSRNQAVERVGPQTHPPNLSAIVAGRASIGRS